MERRVGYVTSLYPKVSHTFIQREVLGLRAIGWTVETFTVQRAQPAELLSPVDHAEDKRTLAIRPLTLRSLCRHLVRPAVKNPGAVSGLIRLATADAHTDPKRMLWKLFYVAEAIMLWSLANERSIRHLHAHFANVSSDLAWLAAEFGSRLDPEDPWVWSMTVHGSGSFMEMTRHGLAAKAAHADRIVCISDFTRAQVMLNAAANRWDRFSVVHCAIDPEHFNPVDRERREAVEILFVGRIDDVKGLPLIIDAIELVTSRTSTAVSFTVVGDGPSRDLLERRAAAAGIDITFLGALGQHELRPILDQADVFCMASFQEGVPVVLMEAMSCGLACASTDISGIPELITHGETGLLYRPGRVEPIADALQRLVDDAELRARLGAAGRQKVMSQFNINTTVAELDSIFAELHAERVSQ